MPHSSSPGPVETGADWSSPVSNFQISPRSQGQLPMDLFVNLLFQIAITGCSGDKLELFSNHSAVKREQIIFILNIIRRRQESGIGISFNDS